MLVPADNDIPPPRRTRISAVFEQARRSLWPLGDQILISGANFTVHVLAARMLARDEFGVFSIVVGGLMLANILQSTLITQPHNVLGATKSGEDYREYTSASGLGQLLICCLELLVVGVVVAVAFYHRWAGTQMTLALLPTIFFWQAQEWARRVLYTEERHRRAFYLDLITYGGSSAGLAILYLMHLVWGIRVSGAQILYVLASTAAIAVALGLYELRGKFTWPVSTRGFWENWHFGKWLAAGEILGWCSSIHMQIWWAALLLGAAQSADLRIAQVLFGPTRVVAFYLATVLPIQFARALHAGGTKALHDQLRRALGFVIPLTGLYCLALAAFPEPVLRVVYGGQYSNPDAAAVLSLYAISAFLHYLQIVVSAALMASGQTQRIFAAQIWACIAALSASPVLILAFGTPGAVFSVILSTALAGMLLVRAYLQVRSTAGVRPSVPELTRAAG